MFNKFLPKKKTENKKNIKQIEQDILKNLPLPPEQGVDDYSYATFEFKWLRKQLCIGLKNHLETINDSSLRKQINDRIFELKIEIMFKDLEAIGEEMGDVEYEEEDSPEWTNIDTGYLDEAEVKYEQILQLEQEKLIKEYPERGEYIRTIVNKYVPESQNGDRINSERAFHPRMASSFQGLSLW